MKTKSTFTLCLLLFMCRLHALTITSIGHSDWDDTLSWSGHQVPLNPDTLIIDKYITFTHDITIQAPTVLVIMASGTICGDHMIIQDCGSKIFNYGYMYIHQAQVKDMWNYNQFYATSFVSISGCSPGGYGQGFQNIPPNAATYVWPPVNCRTSATNWNGVGWQQAQQELRMQYYPNPARDELVVEVEEEGMLRILTTEGTCVLEQQLQKGKNLLVWKQLAAGFYTIELRTKTGKAFSRLLLN